MKNEGKEGEKKKRKKKKKKKKKGATRFASSRPKVGYPMVGFFFHPPSPLPSRLPKNA